jgi:transcriptional regulator
MCLKNVPEKCVGSVATLAKVYRPRWCEINDVAEMAEIVRRRSFGTLIAATTNGFEASPIPWILRGSAENGFVLCGHLVRTNPLVSILTDDQPVLVTFEEMDAYISPSNYPSKATNPEVVPTWNYVAAHLHGRARCVDDAQWIRAAVSELTDHHERDRQDPWQVSDAPEDYLERMVRGIVGVEVQVERWEGKEKLSQNRAEMDRRGVEEALAGDPITAKMADRMRQLVREN